MKIKRQETKETPENIVPLINIVFLLLIFFMLTAKLTPPSPFKLELPNSSAASTQEKKLNDVVYLSQGGQIAYAEQVMSMDELFSKIAPKHKGENALPIKIKADASTSSVVLLQLMQGLKQNQATKIQIMTKQTSKDNL